MIKLMTGVAMITLEVTAVVLDTMARKLRGICDTVSDIEVVRYE